jgi:hypothetical protein
MKLSEHYGLSKTFDMVMTPFDTTSFKLVGKTHPALGIQDFGWHEVYNMQVGDIFHYSGYHTALSSGGGVTTTWLSMKKVLTRTVHGNNDSITYTYQLCRREQVVSTGVITSTFDTITKTYNFVQLANDSTILRMPDEFIRHNNYASAFDRKMNNYRSRQTKEIDSDKFRFLNHCWLIPEAGTISNNWYSEGLGVSEYYKKNSNYIEDEALVYYKKGFEIWGTPVSTDCNTLVSVESAPVKSALQVHVIPNPVNTRAEIIIDGLKSTTALQVALYDYTGRMVYRNTVNSDRFTFERSGIANGLYVLKITAGEMIVSSKILLE